MIEQPGVEAPYAGAQRTQRLSGRLDEIGKIKAALNSPKSHVVHLSGPGGSGKTYLLHHVFVQLGGQTDQEPSGDLWDTGGRFRLLNLTDGLIDFYDPETLSLVGFLNQVRNGFDPEEFPTYDEAEKEYQQLRNQSAPPPKLEAARRRLQEAFAADYRVIAERGPRLVWLLDTAERLQRFSTEGWDELLRPEDASHEVQPWLIQFLAEIPNTTLILAGRPVPELERRLADRHKDAETGYTFIKLAGLDRDGVDQYLTTLAGQLEARGLREEAEALNSLDDQRRRLIHLYTEGMPIRLAIWADLVVDGRGSLAMLTEDHAAAAAPGAPKEVHQEVERRLVERIQDLRDPEDQILRYLSLARPGLDAPRLAAVWGEDESTCARVLKDLRRLAIVKQVGDRTYLHDEAYDLIQRHRLGSPREIVEIIDRLRRHAEAAIRREKKDQERERAALGQPLEEAAGTTETRAGLDDRLTRARRLLRQLQVEALHYAILRNPLEALHRDHYDLAETAFSEQDEELDVQLSAELHRFARNPLNQQYLGSAERWQAFRDAVDKDTAIRWLKRFYHDRRDKHARLREFARDLDTHRPEWLKDPLFRAERECWVGLARIEDGEDVPASLRALETALGELRRAEAQYLSEGGLAVRWRNVLGRLCNNIGFGYAQLRNYREASRWYGQAVEQFRKTKLVADLANTLTNQGYALAQLVEFEDGILKCNDSLELGINNGLRTRVARSYQTLAAIYNLALKPEEAVREAERAREIFTDLADPGGVAGASYTLAEAHRRHVDSFKKFDLDRKWAHSQFQEAESLLNKAIEISAPEGVAPNPFRWVGATLELGCLYRDWALTAPSSDEQKKELFGWAIQRLEEAAQTSDERKYHARRLDALVNLAWTNYYQGDSPKARATLERAFREPYLQEYLPQPAIRLPEKFNEQYVAQIGKAYALRTRIADDEHKQLHDQEEAASEEELTERHQQILHELAEYFVLVFAYYQQISPLHPRFQTNRELLYNTFKTWGERHQPAFAAGVRRAKAKYEIPGQTEQGRFLLDEFLKRHFGFNESLEPGPDDHP